MTVRITTLARGWLAIAVACLSVALPRSTNGQQLSAAAMDGLLQFTFAYASGPFAIRSRTIDGVMPGTFGWSPPIQPDAGTASPSTRSCGVRHTCTHHARDCM
ncbi:MAG: hypothetical protein ACT4P6_19210 [Gemmatimonadaceae bacterium]